MQTAPPQSPAAEPLARLLLQWGVAAPPTPPVAERLGGWLGWADAVGLSQVLAAEPESSVDEAAHLEARAWATAALDRLQADLGAAFDDALLARESTEPAPDGMPLDDLLAPYRLHHAQQQRSMAARIATLRERLRPRVAEASGAGARLAQLDAVFERTVVAHERKLLAGLPALLARRAARHQAADPRRWRTRCWADLQRLLRAELDLRLQPVLGLIESLEIHEATEAQHPADA